MLYMKVILRANPKSSHHKKNFFVSSLIESIEMMAVH